MNEERQVYKQYEARMIQLLRWRFEKSNLKVDDHYKVGDLPLEIDLVVVVTEPEWRPDFSKFPRIFSYFQRHNIIEVKSEQDELATSDLSKLLAYGWHYMAKHNLDEVSDVILTAGVHHLSPKTRDTLLKFEFKPQGKGVYLRDADMKAYVLLITDLPDELAPEELRAFSDSRRRQQVLFACLGDREKTPIVETIFDLYESEVKKIMLNIREESLRNILSVVPKEKIITALGDEKIIAALGDEKIIAALGKKKMLANLSKEDMIAALGGKESFLSTLSKEDMIAALGGKENLFKLLLTELDPKQIQKLLEEKRAN